MRNLVAALVVSLAAFPAVAQETTRYSLEKTADGYVRLNNETGEMSICNERSGDLVCRAAVDETVGKPADTARLAARVEVLERRIAALEAAPQGSANLPSEDEMETALSFMERFFRRFMGIVKDLEEEPKAGDVPTTAPQKT